MVLGFGWSKQCRVIAGAKCRVIAGAKQCRFNSEAKQCRFIAEAKHSPAGASAMGWKGRSKKEELGVEACIVTGPSRSFLIFLQTNRLRRELEELEELEERG